MGHKSRVRQTKNRFYPTHDGKPLENFKQESEVVRIHFQYIHLQENLSGSLA